MEERLVVSDASPLIGLASAGAFDLIRGLSGRVRGVSPPSGRR